MKVGSLPDSISNGFPILMTSTSTTSHLALVRPPLRRRTGGDPTSILPISAIIEPFSKNSKMKKSELWPGVDLLELVEVEPLRFEVSGLLVHVAPHLLLVHDPAQSALWTILFFEKRKSSKFRKIRITKCVFFASLK